jgi:hypothetical protein
MKNLTVSMPEDLARWARVWAAEQDTSVSALLAGLLQAKRDEEVRYESAYGDVLAERPVNLSAGKSYPAPEPL